MNFVRENTESTRLRDRGSAVSTSWLKIGNTMDGVTAKAMTTTMTTEMTMVKVRGGVEAGPSRSWHGTPSGEVIKEEEYHMRKTLTLVFGLSFVLTCVLTVAPAFAASDLTIFGAAEHQGKLTLQGTFLNQASPTQTIISELNPQTFGVFGIRYGHGKVIGGEHTLAYAPNFISSNSKAFIYNSNLLLQAPLPKVT